MSSCASPRSWSTRWNRNVSCVRQREARHVVVEAREERIVLGLLEQLSARRCSGELRARGSSCRRRSAPRRRCSGTSRGPCAAAPGDGGRAVGARARDPLVRDRAQQAPRRTVAGDHGAGREVDERAQHERALVHARVRQRERMRRACDGGRIVANRGRASAVRCAPPARGAGAAGARSRASRREQRPRRERRVAPARPRSRSRAADPCVPTGAVT